MSIPQSTPTLFAPITDDDGDRAWKTACIRGNRAFTQGKWKEAEAWYGVALSEARQLFTTICQAKYPAVTQAAPMLVISASNAAECWLRSGNTALAADILVSTCHDLCAVISDDRHPQAWRLECLCHLKQALCNLSDQCPRAGMSQTRISQEIETAERIAQRFAGPSGSCH